MDKKEKRKWMIIVILIIGIAGTTYIIKKVQERAELQTIQRDLANHLYNNYRIFTVDEKEFNKISEEYNGGEGTITTEEFLEQTTAIREYEEIETVEFTGFSKHPMGGLRVKFLINNVYPDQTILSTRSHETKEWIYSFNPGNELNEYVLDKKESPTAETMREENIIYYKGGIE